MPVARAAVVAVATTAVCDICDILEEVFSRESASSIGDRKRRWCRVIAKAAAGMSGFRKWKLAKALPRFLIQSLHGARQFLDPGPKAYRKKLKP